MAFTSATLTAKGGQVICTGVLLGLSCDLAKNNKIMSMFVLFPLLFLAILKVWLFSPKQSNKDVFLQFLKGTTIK